MTDQLSDLDHAKRGMAALTACIVQTLNESDHTFQGRFLEKIEKAYAEFRDHTAGDIRNELELIAWTRELLTGFNLATGQGKPFLED